MKKIIDITLVSLTTLTLIGCGSSDNNTKYSALKTSQRNVKFLVDKEGMSLYTFDKDTLNQSNCDATCQEKWPFFRGANGESEDIKVLEGTDHLAYRNHPLYYFHKDKAPGDVLGNHVKNVWDLVYVPVGSTDAQTALSATEIKQTFLTDKDQRALYVFDKDEDNVSHCYNDTPTATTGCESTWPVFYSTDLGTLPTGTTASDFGVIDRNASKVKKGEPTKQITYKGKPLYYFAPDNKKALSTKGDWVKGVWHLIDID